MNTAVNYNDLCVSCNSMSLCTRRKNLVRPVWFCEEYDDFMPPVNNKVKTAAKAKSKSAQSNKIENSDKYKGICFNCLNRKICCYANTERIIWHCEEYR